MIDKLDLSLGWNSAMTRTVLHCIHAALVIYTFSAASQACAQDAKKHTLRYAPKFKVGDRWRLTQKASNDLRRTEARAKGKATVTRFDQLIELEGICTAKTVSKQSDWTEISIEISKCTFKDERQTIQLLKPGENLIVTEKDGKRTFKLADGGVLFAEKQRLIGIALGESRAKDEVPIEKLFALDTPRKVGETWRGDPDLLLKSLSGFAKDLGATEVQGSAELTAVEDEDGGPSLKWMARLKAESKSPPVGVPGGVPVFGSFDWKSEQTVPASGDRGKWQTIVTADIKQVFKGKPGSEQADTTFDGVTKRIDETIVEFLDERK
jgi:hypothetical protein